MESNDINLLIKRRRSIFPSAYIERTIPDHIIWQVLENANWAPTHRLTEPWRFKVFRKSALQRLSSYMGNWYKENTPENLFSEKKYEKTKAKPLKSDCVIAICMQRDPEARVPEWEEIASVASAVQNMWLTCTAYGIGCYWSSPGSIIKANDFLELREGERCLGLLYMGYHEMPEIDGKRIPINDKVKWMEK